MPKKVLVSGGSGYIAGFLIRQLVTTGWDVNTTIRSRAKEQRLRDTLGVDDDRLHVFEADLTDDAGWAEAMAGCSHVAHVASPFPVKAVKNDDDLVVPARDGALRALRAAKQAGVERFVMTSSAAAIAYGHPRGRDTFTEADWTDLSQPDVNAYIKSKTIAERAARDWMIASGEGMEFCTINPTAVLGPVMSRDYSSSIQLVERLLTGSLPGCPDFGFGIVDVRDVADIHVRALTAPNMDGERFIASGPFLKMVDVAHILKDRLGDKARKVPTRRLPGFVLKIVALFDSSVRQVTGELGKVRDMDARHAKAVLDWEARDVGDTIEDTALSLIEHGAVTA